MSFLLSSRRMPGEVGFASRGGSTASAFHRGDGDPFLPRNRFATTKRRTFITAHRSLPARYRAHPWLTMSAASHANVARDVGRWSGGLWIVAPLRGRPE